MEVEVTKTNKKIYTCQGDTPIDMMDEEKIKKQIINLITAYLENCAGLGRDAYGDYIKKCSNTMAESIINIIKENQNLNETITH